MAGRQGLAKPITWLEAILIGPIKHAPNGSQSQDPGPTPLDLVHRGQFLSDQNRSNLTLAVHHLAKRGTEHLRLHASPLWEVSGKANAPFV